MLLSSSRPASGLMGKRLLLSTKPLRISHPCCHCSYYSTTTKFDVFGNLPVPAHKRRWIPTSGTHPLGFKVGSIYAGIKPSSPSPDSQQRDLVLVSSELPSNGAAVFTKNEFPAASVTVSKGLLQKTQGYGLRGVVANSGCANLLTGQQGLDDAVAMSEEAGRYGPDKVNQDFMVMHTGMGATRLPIKNILDSIPKVHQSMGNSHNHWLEAARGLCTTDTFPKLASRTFSLPSYPDTSFSMTGLTKGAGMVHPNMATTLAIVCTDAPVTSEALQSLLSAAVDRSYNCISIEGDTSTNDMVVMLANGAAATAATAQSSSEDIPVTFRPSAPLSEQSADFIALKGVLEGFMADMAKLVVRDAEGATKFITIRIRGLASYGAAKHIASVIARSVLVKTGIYGQDPNWVGILAALGYSLIDTQFAAKGIIVPGLTSVSMVDSKNKDEICFLKRGVPAEVDGSKAKNLMAEEDIEVIVNLRDDGKEGNSEEAVYWTSDLTHDFVTMNSDVSS